MELSQPMLDGIVIAGDTRAISDPLFSEILREIVSVMRSEKVTEKPSFEDKSKLAYAGLLTLLLEAAKHDCGIHVVGTVLEDCKMEENRINQFILLYQECKHLIQDKLNKIGKTVNHIIDVNWRQDYVIKSNCCDKIGQCYYILSFKALDLGTTTVEEITFGCTVDQLQDLVFKLKDAAKCVERNSVH